MISAADVPTIDGSMDALAEHARSLQRVGTAFADTGARVHATWQELGAVYRAPEADQLLMATAPVQQVSAAVGDDIRTVGGVLGGYAEEVRAIQARLGSLRLEAAMLETAAVPDEARSDELVTQVNTAMAEFDDAQRRCANAINALRGSGPTYRPDNGDGRVDPGEYGAPVPVPEEENTLHTVLDVVGLVPLAGEVADGINALWYTVDGDYVNAGLSTAAMVPIIGWASTGGKLGVKGYKGVAGLDGLKAFLHGHPTIVPAHAVRMPSVPALPGVVQYRWFEGDKRIVVYARRDPERGAIYRVKEGNNHYRDYKNWRRYPARSLNPYIPSYDAKIADRTHITYPDGQPKPGSNPRRVLAPNPAGLLGPAPTKDGS